MDGIELCKKVKSDQRLSHIPVILLTAKVTDDQILVGYQSGADDYITKPFNFEILLSRIFNLLNKRDLMRKSFAKHIEINPGEITVTPLDEQLINKAIAIVEKNIANTGFSVEELSRELGMSRVHLYKKLLSITGKSPIEFIRTIRLKIAAQLLKKSQLTVSEIAYKVGFNNPKYFSKYFKAEFNVLPSQYILNNKQE
jgi:AraC-like DNA-binding protein